MKLIPLSQKSKKHAGKYFAQVDDDDYDYLMQWPWSVVLQNGSIYAIRTNEEGKSIKMHRVILGLTKNDKILVDHGDRCGINNQKYNLRKATYSQNKANGKSCGKSEYLGVHKTLVKTKKNIIWEYWSTSIIKNGINYFLGSYKDEIKAAFAYNIGSTYFNGEFANLNIIPKSILDSDPDQFSELEKKIVQKIESRSKHLN